MAEEGTAEGEDPTAVVAEASMEAVAESTPLGAAPTIPVAGGTTAPRAGGLTVAAAAIAAARQRLVTAGAPRTVDRMHRAAGQIPTQDALPGCAHTTVEHLRVIEALDRLAPGEIDQRRRGTQGRPGLGHVGRRLQQGLTASGIPSPAARVERALPTAQEIQTLSGRTVVRRVALAQQARGHPLA